MDKTMLALKPSVMLTGRDGKIGLTFHGQARFAKDTRQAEILRALVKRPQPIESLMALLYTGDDPGRNDNDISLAMAGFILDFGDYLEA